MALIYREVGENATHVGPAHGKDFPKAPQALERKGRRGGGARRKKGRASAALEQAQRIGAVPCEDVSPPPPLMVLSNDGGKAATGQGEE